MSTTPPPLPTYLDTGPDPVFGHFHPAAGDRYTGTGVLLCPPFGWEEVCSYRSRRRWAEELASSGRPALRIDLPGAGDSGGTSRDPGLLGRWIGAVTDAARWLGSQAGCERVAAIGIGLGGMLACGALADGATIEELVLWSVPARGRSMVRELRAFALLNPDRGPADEADPPPSDGSLEAGGFLLDSATAEDLSGFDLTKLDLSNAAGRRVLMLEREGIEVDAKLRASLEAAGAEVTIAAGPGYGAMMAHPQVAKAPLETIAVVDQWLAAAETDERSAPAAPQPPDSAEIAVGDTRIRETAITIEQPIGRLFGVLAEPVDGPRAEFSAVLLNAGALRRIGPGRMWVETARRWASRGVPTLRLDVEGIGDADGDAAAYADVAALYVPRLVEQAVAGIDELGRRGLPRRAVLGGLCSGAYWAFQAAVEDERVEAAILVNPRALVWDETIETSREARKGGKVVSRALWRRVLDREVGLRRLLQQLRVTAAALLRYPGALIVERRRRRELEGALDELRDRGKRVLLVFGEREPLHEELERDGLFDRLGNWPNVELVEVPGRNHSLEPLTAQGRVHALLDRALEAELEK